MPVLPADFGLLKPGKNTCKRFVLLPGTGKLVTLQAMVTAECSETVSCCHA